MEADLRSFQPAHVSLMGVETGKERFTKDGLYFPPPLAYWRNNLTALSQRFNLYFVANRDAIAVYRPSFPFQKLYKLPSLLIPPTVANPLGRGYLDPRSPHTINHMVVGDLGTEEIVLVSTDSGNVTAYFTQTIDQAIRKDPYRFNTNARSDYVGVRPFFTQWVHESAWGLAIHTKARMIAVSANTPNHTLNDDPCAKITVFAFALAEGQDEDEADVDELLEYSEHGRQPDWEEWQADRAEPDPPPRDKNYKITLGGVDGHGQNVPSISFVNTDEDLEGEWLLSTDIDGEMKMWQIWRGSCLRTWDFAEKRMRSGFFRQREGGWLVAALDPRAFRSARTMDQFSGYFKAIQYQGHVGESYDLTSIVRLRTPGNSLTHPQIDDALPTALLPAGLVNRTLPAALVHNAPGETTALGSNFLERWRAAGETRSGVESSDSSDTGEDAPNFATHTDANNMAQEANQTEPATDSNAREGMESDEEESDPDGSEVHQPRYGPQQVDQQAQLPSFRSVFASAPVVSNLMVQNRARVESRAAGDPDAESFSSASYRRAQTHQSPPLDRNVRDARGDRTVGAAPRIPTLHCSASNLRLLMPPEADSPHVFCANLLKQVLPGDIEMTNHAHLDRLNMVQQIPELGVVIIASQIGRCAICTTTRNEVTGTLGLRVDWTLPTKTQETNHFRPYMPLLGIATSPIQGCFKREVHSASRDSGGSAIWGTDGVVDGVTTTFDPAVLIVREGENEHDEHDAAAERPQKIHTGLLGDDLGPTSYAVDQRRNWKVPPSLESWQGSENSRRYRLMLTYLDTTVLTYEISRGVERHDVLQTRMG